MHTYGRQRKTERPRSQPNGQRTTETKKNPTLATFMNLEYFIARKVAAGGKKSFTRLIIRIAIIAVALSLTVMIVATALITGFKKEITNKIFGFWGHVHIQDTNVNRSYEAIPIDINQTFYPSLDTVGQIDYVEDMSILGRTIEDRPQQKTTKGGVKHIQVFANKPGIIKTKNEFEGIILKGIGADFDWDFLKQSLQEGKVLNLKDSIRTKGILVSQNTANRLKLKIGQKFIVHFVTDNGNQIKKPFTVEGIYKTGLDEYDRNFALVDIRVIQDILGWEPNQVGGFEVFIDNIDDLDVIAEYIYIEKLPNHLYAQTIKDKSPSIFEWLELQNINEVVILILMIVVAIINMVTALMILILERTNMIGMLKALGSTNWSVRKIFLYYAGFILAVGIFWGDLIGIGLCLLQKHFEFIKLSEADYYLSVAPIDINLWTILLLNIGTLVVTLIFLIIPSYLVTRITPVKAIRFS